MKIALDLDGTLAEYHGWQGEEHIGAPISVMVSRVKEWIASGHEVVIFTARITPRDGEDRSGSVKIIQDWLEAAGLPRLEVTNIKLHGFSVFYDDRATQVESNTGALVMEKAFELSSELRRLLVCTP